MGKLEEAKEALVNKIDELKGENNEDSAEQRNEESLQNDDIQDAPDNNTETLDADVTSESYLNTDYDITRSGLVEDEDELHDSGFDTVPDDVSDEGDTFVEPIVSESSETVDYDADTGAVTQTQVEEVEFSDRDVLEPESSDEDRLEQVDELYDSPTPTEQP